MASRLCSCACIARFFGAGPRVCLGARLCAGHCAIRYLLLAAWLAVFGTGTLRAESANLAPGFLRLPWGASLLLMAPDIELYSLSAGGLSEPRADWTEAALNNVHTALTKRTSERGLKVRTLSESEAETLAEVNSLHAAVARSISFHHFGSQKLPTKQGKLDWSLGDAVLAVRAASGCDYALFVWIRDSYASAERKVTMVAMALFGVALQGGVQVGYASLVDLRSGQVLWFNQIVSGSGDLREPEPAAKAVSSLLQDFPSPR